MSECVIVEDPVGSVKMKDPVKLEEDDGLIPTDILAIKHEISSSQNAEHQNLFQVSLLSPLKLLPKKPKKLPPNKGHGKLECEICGKRFCYPRSFRHHRLSHQNELIQCKICFKMIKPAAFNYHMNYKHTDERKFKCPVCGRRFKSPGAMRHHETTLHSQEDAYQFECTKCETYFESQQFLEAHIKQFHLPVKVEELKCKYCNEVFDNTRLLRLHIGVLGKVGKCRNTFRA